MSYWNDLPFKKKVEIQERCISLLENQDLGNGD